MLQHNGVIYSIKMCNYQVNVFSSHAGKAVYVTATLPYILLLALTARALTLNGAHEGLRYLFYPKWSMMLDAQVCGWADFVVVDVVIS